MQVPRGRARGRSTTQSSIPPNPAISQTTDATVVQTSGTSTVNSETPCSPETQQPSTTSTSNKEPTDEAVGPSTAMETKSTPPMGSSTAPKGRGKQRHQPTSNDQKATKATSETTIRNFSTNNRPTKPNDLGIIGQPIQLSTNFFPITHFPTKGTIFKYHIKILDAKQLEIHRDRRRFFYSQWLQKYLQRYPHIDRHKIVFDNATTILSIQQSLPDIDDNTPAVNIRGPNRFYRQALHTVIVTTAGPPIDLAIIKDLNQLFDSVDQFNYNPQELQTAKQMLSIALHECCSTNAQFIHNRSFFSSTKQSQYGEWDLGFGRAIWRGFYSCLVFSKGNHQLLMNIDVKHSVFMKKQPFLEFLCEIMLYSPCGKQEYGGQRQVRKVNGNDALRYLDTTAAHYSREAQFLLKHCENLRIRSQNANVPIVYTIKKLGKAASEQRFVWKVGNESRTVTVEEYYRSRYNQILRYPSLPTLEVRNQSYLPMELVDIEPVRIKKITDEQRALLCRNSSMRPYDYAKSILKIRQNPREQCFEEDPFVAAWNMNVSKEMLTIPARVLPMPDIIYNEQYQVNAQTVRDIGVWDMKMTPFHQAAAFPENWGLINLTSLPEKKCEDFSDELSILARRRGMSCTMPSFYEENNCENLDVRDIDLYLSNLMKKHSSCRFVVIILPRKTIRASKAAYKTLKAQFELDTGYGVITQMVQETTAMAAARKEYGKFANVILKINTKLNGLNSILKVHDVIERFFSKGHRVMYVGVDLSHVSQTNKIQRSIAAVVASADDVPCRYFKEIYEQCRPVSARKDSREYVVSMKEIMKSLISQYEQLRGYPPNAIVIYRDGISESEFDTVFEKELTAIREACVDLSPAYQPYLTYIVVTGTVVDSHDITNPLTYDFYLSSHHGALGTSRPTHYHVLYDDNKLKPDEVQMLTYALCYTYARCTRAISIPTPVKYADLLALRASYYLHVPDDSDSELVVSEPGIPLNPETDVNSSITSRRLVLHLNIAADCPFFV